MKKQSGRQGPEIEIGNELENLHYHLNHERCSEEVRINITKAVLRLPQATKEKVIDQVIFIDATNRTYGFYVNLGAGLFANGQIHLIFLNFSTIESDEEKEYVVAHEIAHFILGHTTDGDYEKQEGEADSLSEKWGFDIPERRKNKSYLNSNAAQHE